jgi:outer membrane protein OmpA-like peptidoglycan-associated protein
MRFGYKLLLLLAIAPMTLAAQTKKFDAYRAKEGITLPTWAVKTNLLADLTTSMNLAFEFRTGNRTSLDLMGQWNPFQFRNGLTKWKHWGVQPEFRYWTKETFRGHFFGLHAHYAFYNVGGLWNGPFTDYMHNNRFQGSLYGAGVSWGHRWNFSDHVGLEVTAGLGYAYKDYSRYECKNCGEKLEDKTKHYFGPTKFGVNLIFGGGGKQLPRVVVVPPPAPVAPPPVVEPYKPKFTPSFIIPMAEPVKVRNESGSAYLEFPVGKAVIDPGFRANSAELARIHDMISRVQNDPDAKITNITLVGNASPEGAYQSNMTLSQKRADALRDYISQNYQFPANLITSRGAGEDWTTLATLVDQSLITGRGALLEIIEGQADYDARDRQMIARNSAAYNEMKTEIYPKLRRTDYQLDFEVAPISVERGKEIMRTNPRNLSLNELFRIAETYQPGSEEFREVMEIAARAFPESDVASNNAAAAALVRGDAGTAIQFLRRVKDHDAAWNNTMGILSFLQGEPEKAIEHFRAAGAKSTSNISELGKHLDSLQK